MLRIVVAPAQLEPVTEWIAGEPRLHELVAVETGSDPEADPHADIWVHKKGITLSIDWKNRHAPYVLPENLPAKSEVLLGLVYFFLGNNEKTWELLQHMPALLQEIDIMDRLRIGMEVNPEELASEYSDFEEYRLMHNQAVVRHYAANETTFDGEKVRYFYHEAMVSAPDDAWKAFSAKQYAVFLTDMGHLEHAEDLLLGTLQYAPSPSVKLEIKQGLCAVWMRKLAVPYDPVLLTELKETLWEVLQYLAPLNREAERGLLLVDAAQIANYADSFAESLGYVNQAVDIFRKEGLDELLANAQFRKGTLLYTWAKQGNPQFYRPAVEAFQQALKVFNREQTPEVFAEIQHILGVIYSEIPDEVKKKSVWAAVSSSAFTEALSIFEKETYPYEYALVCNSYGNALTKYPAAVRSDNHQKALHYYQEALEIRTAGQFPLERALTLLNHVEASWYVQQDTDEFNEGRYLDMVAKSLEVKQLVSDPQLHTEADQHLARLDELKKAYAVQG